MLKRLKIQNFQAHKELTLDFDEGVTTIVGPSDVGKSAIIRALIWVATNRPAGTEFIRDGAKMATVTLEVDDHVIIRERSKSINRYTLDGTEFTAFGTEPPKEVTDVLNLSGVNFQHQHDSPFWFSLPAGEVSRQLNEIVNLSVIDQTLSGIDKARREAMTKVRLLKEEVEGSAQLRKEMAWAKKAAEDLTEVREFHALHVEASGDCQRLTELSQAVSNYGAEQKRCGDGTLAAEKAVEAGESWASVREQEANLQTLLSQIEDEQSTASQEVPEVEPLIKLMEAWDEATVRFHALKQELFDIRDADKEVEEASQKVEALEAEFKERMGDTCPLCGTKL